MMDKNKLLEEYIELEFSDCMPLDDDQKKYIADTYGFQGYCLGVAWEDFKAEIRKIFPFNLFLGSGD